MLGLARGSYVINMIAQMGISAAVIHGGSFVTFSFNVSKFYYGIYQHVICTRMLFRSYAKVIYQVMFPLIQCVLKNSEMISILRQICYCLYVIPYTFSGCFILFLAIFFASNCLLKHKSACKWRSGYIVGINLSTNAMKLDQELAADHTVSTYSLISTVPIARSS